MNAQPLPEAVAPEAVRLQLALILASTPFKNATRSRRFLEFAVNETLAGASDAVKESVLALEVFDRPNDFDSRLDSIVRVEASKLRNRLQEYYKHEGATASVLIDIPKGMYVPQFALRSAKPKSTPSRWPSYAAYAAVILSLIAAAFWFTRPNTLEIRSIAVLPFLNLSSEAQTGYFSDGLADQLTDALAQVDGLRVASRTSAFTFRSKSLDAKEIGAKLHVDAILEGSVQKIDSRLRITLQIIRTHDGYHIWSKTFDRENKDVFAIQDDLSHSVIRALNFSIADELSRKISRRFTRNPEAFDLYLRGRFELDHFHPDSAAKATALFERAIELDPNFALAHSYLASAASHGMFWAVIPPAEIRKQTQSAANKALALDSTLAEPQAILALVEARFDWNWAGAEKRFRHAIQLNPRSPEAHLGLAQAVLLPLRRFDEALAECALARQLDPLYAQTAYCTPWVHMMQGNSALALEEFEQLSKAKFGSSSFRGAIATSALHAGREADVIAMAERDKADFVRLRAESPSMLAFLGYAYGRVGRLKEANQILQLFEATPTSGYVSPGARCLIHLGLGHLAEARQAAVEQINEHEPNAYYLALDPVFAPLRSDPDFAKLLKTLGLPF